MNFILSLDIDDFVELVLKGLEKREGRKAWEMWLMKYPHMTKENFIPFSQFYSKLTQPISKRPAEEILAEADEIRKQVQSRKVVKDHGDI
jgi:hypothetical protein